MDNKPSKAELGVVEKLMTDHLEDYGKAVIEFDKKAEAQGIDSHRTTAALLTTHGVILGSLMATSLISQMQKQNLETLNSNQLFAFLAFTQQQLLAASQETFFKVMKEKYGLDMDAVGKAMTMMKAEDELNSDDFGDDGKEGSGMLPC